MENNVNKSRVKREAEIYDEQKLERDTYDRVLEHANTGPSRIRRDDFIKKIVEDDIENKNVLELGSQAWPSMFAKFGLKPKNITCINISKTEIESGKKQADGLGYTIDFKLMDAHHLDFPDETFDLVYGVAILHHLELEQAISEVRRVLRKGGVMIFVEPLNINPVAKLVRYLTPKARTPDEKPFTRQELQLIDKYFDSSNLYTDFLSVPASIVSSIFTRNPVNWFAKLVDSIDNRITEVKPNIGKLYRSVTLYGKRKE